MSNYFLDRTAGFGDHESQRRTKPLPARCAAARSRAEFDAERAASQAFSIAPFPTGRPRTGPDMQEPACTKADPAKKLSAAAVILFTLMPAIWIPFAAAADGPALEALGRLDAKLIPEASGIAKSRKHAGIFWVHNDSGNLPLLFAIRADGRIVQSFRLEVPNVDWEDITLDGQGNLVLGDIGNNTGALPVRVIYRLPEPDPNAPADRPLKMTASVFYAPARSNRFDAEGLVFDRGAAILIAKYRDGRDAELFSVALEPPSPLLRPAQPRLVGRLARFTEPVTGAALSADRALLAVCSSSVTRVYRRGQGDPPAWDLHAEVQYESRPVEGITWDGSDLVLVAEGSALYRLAERTWRAGVVPHATPGKAKR